MLYTRISLLRNITFGQIPKKNWHPNLRPFKNITKTNEISTIPRLKFKHTMKTHEISKNPRSMFKNAIKTNDI